MKYFKLSSAIFVIGNFLITYSGHSAVNHHQNEMVYILPELVFDNNQGDQHKNEPNTQSLPVTKGSVDYQINHSLIVKSASQSISSSINNISGVQDYNNTGNNPLFYIRGQRANITVNGIPLNQFDSSAQSLNLIPFSAIKSISISPVGNSVLYGSMGIGGQINIETNDEINNQFTLSPAYPLYGNDYLSVGSNLDNEWKMLINQQGQLTNSYRDFSQVFNNTIGASFIRHSTNDKTKIFINESTQTLQFPGALTLEQASENPWQASSGRQNYNTQSIFTGVQNHHDFNQDVATESYVTYQQLWANGNFPGIPEFDTNFGQYYSQLELKPILEHSINISGQYKLKNQLGVDTNFQTFKQTNTISHSRQNSYGIFVMPSMDLTETLNFGLGGRFDYITTNGDFSDGQSGDDVYRTYAYYIYLQQKWDQHYITGVRVSRDYQLPFIDQSSLTPNPISTFGLQPQTSISYSLSQKVTYDQWSFGVDAYFMDIKNQIIFNPNVSNTGFFNGANVNLPPTQQYGLIISGDIQPLQSMNLGASITLSRNIFKADDTIAGTNGQPESLSGNSVPGVPNILGEFHSNIKIIDPVNWYLQLQYTGSMYADGDFSNQLGKVAGYLLVNTAVSYKIAAWLISLRVNNLFNKHYNVFTTTNTGDSLSVYPANGTNGALMITYEFK